MPLKFAESCLINRVSQLGLFCYTEMKTINGNQSQFDCISLMTSNFSLTFIRNRYHRAHFDRCERALGVRTPSALHVDLVNRRNIYHLQITISRSEQSNAKRCVINRTRKMLLLRIWLNNGCTFWICFNCWHLTFLSIALSLRSEFSVILRAFWTESFQRLHISLLSQLNWWNAVVK